MQVVGNNFERTVVTDVALASMRLALVQQEQQEEAVKARQEEAAKAQDRKEAASKDQKASKVNGLGAVGSANSERGAVLNIEI